MPWQESMSKRKSKNKNESGGGEIRTHEAFGLPVFKTGAINRSATPPNILITSNL